MTAGVPREGGGLFPKGAAIRQVYAHPAVLLGGGRALLMQLADPGVARGVAEHSDFEADPFGRLRRTLDAVNAIVYGPADVAYQTAAAVRAVHQRVSGPGYSATDPELVLWVHATLVDTAMRMHARWVRPLPPAVADAFYADAIVMGELFGVPAECQPPDRAAFDAYVRDTTSGLAAGVNDDQRRLAGAVLHPRVPSIADPLVGLGRQLTVGLLPDPIRDAFGLRWDRPREAALRATGLGTRLATAQLRLARRAVSAGIAA